MMNVRYLGISYNRLKHTAIAAPFLMGDEEEEDIRKVNHLVPTANGSEILENKLEIIIKTLQICIKFYAT